MKSIAIFGGTFNPVHNGHIHNAAFVLRNFNIDKVLFVPSKIPVHKEMDYDPGPQKRYTMLQLALQKYPGMEASSIEIDRSEASYSYLTVEAVRKRYNPKHLCFILGTDSFNTLRTWREYGRLRTLLEFIVLVRPGDRPDESIMSEVMFHLADNAPLEISSTRLRSMLIEKKDCTQMMDDAVLAYIRSEELYSK